MPIYSIQIFKKQIGSEFSLEEIVYWLGVCGDGIAELAPAMTAQTRLLSDTE